MSELTEQTQPISTPPEPKRSPVMWKIASVTSENQTVTVVFPSGSGNTEFSADAQESAQE